MPLTLEVVRRCPGLHGSPTDDLTYLLETVEEDGARPATQREVLAGLGDEADRPLLLCGHTHLQRAMRLPTGATVVNPGSVGWPAYADDQPHPHVMEAGTPHARYAVVDDDDRPVAGGLPGGHVGLGTRSGCCGGQRPLGRRPSSAHRPQVTR